MTPQELLDRLTAVFPAFAEAWDGPENYFRNDDGSFTYCGVFAEFSFYFKDRFEQFNSIQLGLLSELLDSCMEVVDSELGNTAATCFLENVAGERFHAEFAEHLRAEALSFYRNWDDAIN